MRERKIRHCDGNPTPVARSPAQNSRSRFRILEYVNFDLHVVVFIFWTFIHILALVILSPGLSFWFDV